MSLRPNRAHVGAVGAEGSRTENFTFYLGTHEPSWLATMDVPLFVSRRRLARRKSLPVAVCDWMLDSGGFTELQMYGKWTISAEDYAAAVVRYQRQIGRLVAAAPRDWMCEPAIINGGVFKGVRFVGTKLSVAEHQRRTVEDFVTLRDLAPNVPWMPVVQGWRCDDYVRCVELYARAGIDLEAAPVVGVGSVCRRQHTSEAAHIFGALAGLGLKLHGFGVSALGLERYAGALASADSLAWSYNARRHPAMEGCAHKNCSNCRRWALRWRDNALDGLVVGAAQMGLAL